MSRSDGGGEGRFSRGWDEGLERLLRRVEKPGRYVGGEWNEVRKDPERVEVTVGLAFPDVYEIGMSHLGQKILYGLLNSRPEVAAERVFAPWPDMEGELRAGNAPLFTLENKIPLHRLDILGFSLLYELNDSNILTILDMGRIPLLAADRSEEHPLVAGGGPAAFNPEPLADIIDVFVLGDGEEAVLDLVDLRLRMKRAGAARREQLRELSRLAGMYVPSLYRPVREARSPLLIPEPTAGAPAGVVKRSVGDFSRSYFPRDVIVPDVQTVFDRVAVEASRGCPHRCRFCQAAAVYFPYRVKNPSRLMETTIDSVGATGFQDVSLSSLSISDYPYLDRTVRILMDALSRDEVSLSLPSLRPSGLSTGLAESILRVRKTGFTLVPEAGTERMRRVINKCLSDDDLFRAAETAFAQGWRLLKLYFMIGLPGEETEDLEAVVRLVKSVLSLGWKKLGFPPQVNLSLSSFIPKPHTPFQWLAMEDARELAEKQRYIVHELKRHRSVSIKAHRLEQSLLEAVFSRGDRRLAGVLMSAWRNGARFDGWKDAVNEEAWAEAFARQGVDRKDYLGALDIEARLPWDHVDTGLPKELLLEELRRAGRGETTPSCLDAGACGGCQGCRPGFRPEKTFGDVPAISPRQPDRAGREAAGPVRYRAVYEKSGRARYLAHNDLINVLRRSFRRAGVSVLHAGGFHPKMRMSFLPAMPLGMRGLAEALEFMSDRLLDEEEFLERIGRSLPEGIRFSGLEKRSSDDLSLSRDTLGFLYSLDLTASDVRASLETLPAPAGSGGAGESAALDRVRAAVEALTKVLDPETVALSFSPGGETIRFRVETAAKTPPRLQDKIREALGLEGAAFFLTRESPLYRSKLTSSGESGI